MKKIVKFVIVALFALSVPFVAACKTDAPPQASLNKHVEHVLNLRVSNQAKDVKVTSTNFEVGENTEIDDYAEGHVKATKAHMVATVEYTDDGSRHTCTFNYPLSFRLDNQGYHYNFDIEVVGASCN